MGRWIVRIVLALTAAAGLAAQDAPLGSERYTGTLELEISIEQLSTWAAQGQAAVQQQAAGKAFLLTGSMAKPIQSPGDTYTALIEFSEGKWIGTSRIELFRVYLELAGAEFEALGGITPGTRAIVVADKPTVKAGPDGKPAIYLRVISLRLLR
ncbi:MAG TPA: hypothetical protein PK625_00110 [Spirochaetales bacterium]|nr:hypothetical protein [Spirochaetia bacterium]HPE35525.1 hypothetical protein [Spirochaetales bacterium]